MKRIDTLLIVVFCTSIFMQSFAAQVVSDAASERAQKGEQIFIENADKCLDIIHHAANKLPIQGAVVIAYVPGEVTKSWISKMKIVGCYTNEHMNFLSVASSKIAEMATTLSTEKRTSEKLLKGEWGYQGKVIQKVKSGYLLAAFSGGSAAQDAAVAQKGMDWLAEKYK